MAEKEPVGWFPDEIGLKTVANDLIIVALWMFITILFICVPILNKSIFRVIFVLPIILFIPGYVLIAALFPGKEDLDGIERLALSFGFSMVVVSLIGLVLNYTWGIRIAPIIGLLFIFTSAMLVIAQYRRLQFPPEKRFFISFHKRIVEMMVDFLKQGQSRKNWGRFIILTMIIFAVIGTVIYVFVVPKEDEKYTEFYILGPGDKATDYPRRFPVGEEQSLIIGIVNHEHQNITYTTETILLAMRVNPITNQFSINTYQPLDNFTVTLSHNETREFLYNFSVKDQRFNRLEILLFNETLPSSGIEGQKRFDASYRELHLWFTVISEGAL